MQEISVIELEIDQDYFERIKKIVRDNHPLITTTIIEDIYCLERYIIRNKSTKLKGLLDNNIFTRVVYLAKGNKIEEKNINSYRFCCAVMCFFKLGAFTIEPDLALYERTSKNSHSNAIEDLYHFRIADNIHPMGYARLALGLANRFSDEEIENAKSGIDGNFRDTEESNYGKLLDDWKLKYLHLLKITELSKYKLKETERVKKFFEWIVNDCSTSPGSIVFALMFLSPKRPGGIKNINSRDFNKLKNGIKNAAWDLTYITGLRKLSKHQSEATIWFFCSHDELLQKIARNLHLKEGQEVETAMQNLINEFWGKSNDRKVCEYYADMNIAISSNDKKRRQHNEEVRIKIDQMIEDLESKVLSLSS
ncbi:MAG: hypothetical protein ACXW0Q_08735 [Methylovulum sp.]